MNILRRKIDYTLKHNVFIHKSFRFFASLALRAIGVFIPIDEKSIIFSAHSRKYNDSPKAIYEYMILKPEFEDYSFYWALDDPNNTDIPGNCIKIIPDTFQYFLIALKCKYWITCVNIERSLRFKRKKTIYLNTWHGIPIKTVGNCAEGRKDYNFSNIDYFCISGDYEIDIYKSSFNILEKNLIKTGMPRNDVLYRTTPTEIKKIKERLCLPLDKKIILYVPTWRDSKDSGRSYSLKPPFDILLWEKKLRNDYILLLRTHPYTNKLLGVEFNEFLRDFTNYYDINDLLKISDILISDYSATIFDYAILERPIISFAYDFDEYDKERGFALDLRNEIPGGICNNETDVIDRILNMDYFKEVATVKAFKKKYLTYGANATEKCVNILFNQKSEDCK